MIARQLTSAAAAPWTTIRTLGKVAFVNEFTRFILDQMGQRDWRASDLAAASGLSKQQVSKLVNDTRDVMDQLPKQATIEGLARAFSGVPIAAVRAMAVQGLGVPASDTPTLELDLAEVSIDALLAEIKRRVVRSSDEDTSAAQSTTASRSSSSIPGDRQTPMTDQEIAKELALVAVDPQLSRSERNRRITELMGRMSVPSSTSIAEGDGDAGAKKASGA